MKTNKNAKIRKKPTFTTTVVTSNSTTRTLFDQSNKVQVHSG